MTFDFVGFLFGAIGAALLALKIPALSRWGFVFFLGSNVAWILFALEKNEQWLLIQTIVFSVTSLIGVFTWFIQPQLKSTASWRHGLCHDVTSSLFMPRLSKPTPRCAAARSSKAG